MFPAIIISIMLFSAPICKLSPLLGSSHFTGNTVSVQTHTGVVAMAKVHAPPLKNPDCISSMV